MKLIDAHCHLDDDRFTEDLDEVISRFREKGGKVIVTSGVNPKNNRKALEIMGKYPDVVRVSFGIFPIDAIIDKLTTRSKENNYRKIDSFDLDSELSWIEEHKDECVAIGEVGLDYSDMEVKESEELRNLQKENFRKIIDLAKKLGKTIVVHTRKAESDCIDLLEEKSAEKVILHCFTGNKKLIRRAAELGWTFTVPCVITRLEHFKMLVEMLPLSQLLTETDGAFLSPVAGTRNEPANIELTIKEIAKIKNLSEEEVSEKIFENYEKLFGRE